MSWITARLAAAGDTAAANVTKVVWYKGTAGNEVVATEVAATAVTLASATNANPSVVANAGALESEGASGAVDITAWAFADAADAAQTTINRFPTEVPLVEGGKVTVEAGALKVNMHQATSAP